MTPIIHRLHRQTSVVRHPVKVPDAVICLAEGDSEHTCTRALHPCDPRHEAARVEADDLLYIVGYWSDPVGTTWPIACDTPGYTITAVLLGWTDPDQRGPFITHVGRDPYGIRLIDHADLATVRQVIAQDRVEPDGEDRAPEERWTGEREQDAVDRAADHLDRQVA